MVNFLEGLEINLTRIHILIGTILMCLVTSLENNSTSRKQFSRFRKTSLLGMRCLCCCFLIASCVKEQTHHWMTCSLSALYVSTDAILNLKKITTVHLWPGLWGGMLSPFSSVPPKTAVRLPLGSALSSVIPTPHLQAQTGDESQQLQKARFGDLN